MTTSWDDAARACLEGAESGAMNFPQVVGALIEAGFDGYTIDLRRGTATYYRPDGKAAEFQISGRTASVAEHFDVSGLKQAIGEAQSEVPGYTYTGFCTKAAAAGCAGYLVSLVGMRVLYYGRTAETHTEYFPGTQPVDWL